MKLRTTRLFVIQTIRTFYILCIIILCVRSTECCTPAIPLPDHASSPSVVRMAPSTAARVFGEQTQGSNGPPIQIERTNAIMGRPVVPEPYDLYCSDFDEKCRWRNMEGLLVDELDWYQGAGFLDEARLRLATGTHIAPEGYYGIAATDKIEFPASKAVLVSDIVECQLGESKLKFSYWTSPEVRVVVCTKTLIRLFPDYDYCSPPVENGDPGPAEIILPDLNGQAFQIYLRAENFVFHTANLQGGFAIIDNIEYEGSFCNTDTKEEIAASNQIQPSHAPFLPQLFAPPSQVPQVQPTTPHPNLFLSNDQDAIINSLLELAKGGMKTNISSNTLATPLPWTLFPPFTTTEAAKPQEDKQPITLNMRVQPSQLEHELVENSLTEQKPLFINQPGNQQSQFPLLQLGQATKKLSPLAASNRGVLPQQPFPLSQQMAHLLAAGHEHPIYAAAAPNYPSWSPILLAQLQQQQGAVQHSPVKPELNSSDLTINVNQAACYALNCSFDDHCAEYVLKKPSEWHLSRKPVGNPLTGIRGDASQLPFNKDGTFVYTVGPKLIARFSTKSFTLSKNAYLMFAYHKVARKADLRLLVKRVHAEQEEILFEAPKLIIESRRWFREVRRLAADTYSYLAFEVENLPPNSYIGVDELVLLDDESREPLCQASASPNQL